MSRASFPFAMTLRLKVPMAEELENLAFERDVSRAQLIRTILAHGIADAHANEAGRLKSGRREGTL